MIGPPTGHWNRLRLLEVQYSLRDLRPARQKPPRAMSMPAGRPLAVEQLQALRATIKIASHFKPRMAPEILPSGLPRAAARGTAAPLLYARR